MSQLDGEAYDGWRVLLQLVPRLVMPSRTLLLLGALWALSGPAGGLSAQDDPPRAGPIALDAMTFNIRTSAIDDGRDSWEFRKGLVAETIRGALPHIVGMQEALGEQIAFLEEALPEYRWVGVDRGLNGGTGLSEATPIFYRHAELVPIESGTFWLGDPPSSPFRGGRGGRGGSRIVTWARFHHIESARQIWVFNTHFSPREGQAHLDGMARIHERVAALPPGSVVLVLGDFNAGAGWSETWQVATSNGLRDAWDLAAERRGPPQTFGGFGPPEDESLGRIDWILVSGSVEVSLVETVLHNAEGRYPSDHYPVRAALVVRPS
ncbi:MAG: endonuclease/exonuclease/phosphatase family protein [Longimicrobiales bacterium]